mmetsp:Transcript_52527/g.85112  ORF Transcript_52527/g.85112 Transcript_52527/m.85112 type:complete len:101 (-) Transcript_52527:948-1250(-)
MTVLKRCAMSTTVQRRSTSSFSMAPCTMASFSASRAEVASSKNSSLGFRRKHRAIASRCLCPPDSMMPFSPTRVSYPSSISETYSWQFAAVQASMTSSRV